MSTSTERPPEPGERPPYHVSEKDFPRRICRECRRVLAYRRGRGSTRGEYEHALQPEHPHPVDPVKPSLDLPPAFVCDFCSAPGPRWVFPTRAFSVAAQGWRSADDWAACDDCHRLIVVDQYERLLKRSARSYLRKHGTLGVATLSALSDLHETFRAHRMGPAVAVDAGQVIL